MSCVAIIPARANSKGLPGKNLKEVGGVSLIGRAIEAATHSKCVSRVIVSTDGHDIANEALKYSAEVIMRPATLASDSSRTIDAVCHALEYVEMSSGLCILLQPTSPLRSSEDVSRAVDLYNQKLNGSLISVCESEHHPFKTLIKSEIGEIGPIINLGMLESPRQDLPLAYRVNGAIYINRVEDLLSRRTFFVEPLQIYEMSSTLSIDIDNVDDLLRANSFLKE